MNIKGVRPKQYENVGFTKESVDNMNSIKVNPILQRALWMKISTKKYTVEYRFSLFKIDLLFRARLNSSNTSWKLHLWCLHQLEMKWRASRVVICWQWKSRYFQKGIEIGLLLLRLILWQWLKWEYVWNHREVPSRIFPSLFLDFVRHRALYINMNV